MFDGMDALLWTLGAVASLYTVVEIAGLLLRADPPGQRRVTPTTEFRQGPDLREAAFQASSGGHFTIDLEPIPGRQTNYYG